MDVDQARKEVPFGELAQSRHNFLVSDRLLLSPEKMVVHSGRWVGAYQGEVRAVDNTLEGLLGRLQGLAIPLQAVAIRFIEEDGMAAP
jgi:hypothetical protein